MDFIAVAVLFFVGCLLIGTDFALYRQLVRSDTLLYGKATVGFAVTLTVAYYLSLYIVLF